MYSTRIWNVCGSNIYSIIGCAVHLNVAVGTAVDRKLYSHVRNMFFSHYRTAAHMHSAAIALTFDRAPLIL